MEWITQVPYRGFSHQSKLESRDFRCIFRMGSSLTTSTRALSSDPSSSLSISPSESYFPSTPTPAEASSPKRIRGRKPITKRRKISRQLRLIRPRLVQCIFFLFQLAVYLITGHLETSFLLGWASSLYFFASLTTV